MYVNLFRVAFIFTFERCWSYKYIYIIFKKIATNLSFNKTGDKFLSVYSFTLLFSDLSVPSTLLHSYLKQVNLFLCYCICEYKQERQHSS